jgi:predicted nucleotidyltransferase
LRTERNVRFALLFGSGARGDDTPHSDLDLLVEMRDPTLERVVDLSARLEDLLGRRVDVLPIEEAEGNPALLADAVAEGRVLVDREHRWAELGDRREALMQQAKRRDRRRTREALAGIDRFLA